MARRLTRRNRLDGQSWWAVYGPTLGAILAAAAAIATALISSGSNSADTERRITRERQVARSEAVGAARVLAGELATPEVYMQGMLRTDRLFPYDPKYDVQLPQEDLKAVASALGVNRWQQVAAALGNLDTLGFFIRNEYRRGTRRLHRGHIAVFKGQIAAIDDAWEALDPLSGTPKLRAGP